MAPVKGRGPPANDSLDLSAMIHDVPSWSEAGEEADGALATANLPRRRRDAELHARRRAAGPHPVRRQPPDQVARDRAWRAALHPGQARRQALARRPGL